MNAFDDEHEVAYIPARCKHETDKALLCVVTAGSQAGEELWVPKSLIEGDSEVREKDDEGELAIPWWFAEKEGVV